jgi:hypothetical protein
MYACMHAHLYRCIACAVGQSMCTSDIEIAGMGMYVYMYACVHVYIYAPSERACVQVI